MTMDGSNMSGTLFSALSGLGFSGDNLTDYCDAIGIGSIDNHLVGLAFTTEDEGTTPGAGVGTGTGLSGLDETALANALFQAHVSAFGQAGDDLQDLCDQLAAALISEIALATLSSTHTPVFSGTGEVVPGSIPVDPTAWGSAIESEGAGFGFVGDNWPDAAESVASEYAAAMANATGTVDITGSPSSSSTSPGTGTGSGTLS